MKYTGKKQNKVETQTILEYATWNIVYAHRSVVYEIIAYLK